MSATITHPPKIRRNTFLQLPDFIPEGHRTPCRDADPDLFFPIGERYSDEGRRVCAGCPVKAACAEWATDTEQRWGLWGGLDPWQLAERRRLRELTS